MADRLSTIDALRLALEALEDARIAVPVWIDGVRVFTREPQLARWIVELLVCPPGAVAETLARYQDEDSDEAYASHCRALAAALLRTADIVEGK
jgi:hypothetical protein